MCDTDPKYPIHVAESGRVVLFPGTGFRTSTLPIPQITAELSPDTNIQISRIHLTVFLRSPGISCYSVKISSV